VKPWCTKYGWCWRVLTEMYNTQDYWVYRLFPSSCFLNHTKVHDVSKTGAVSILRWVSGRCLLCWVL
jgi:hypothetical protein